MKTILATVAILAAALLSTQAGHVKENWDQHCAKCHGAAGKGDTKMGQKLGAKDYTDPKVQAAMKDENAFKAIKNGLTVGGKEQMKPFGDKLSDGEIKALVEHMRTFKK
jgi:mono/diheme cytochrome c family protein